MYSENYAVKSLELHLFFGRIMKEHSLFLRAGFTPANANFAEKAEFYKNKFERLLSQAVALSGGIIGNDVRCSGELVTDFTLPAERQTQRFTGIEINRNITERQLRQQENCSHCKAVNMTDIILQVRRLNRESLRLLDGLIAFKENILNNVLCCKMFTMNYPLLIEHIIREAKLYRRYIATLEREGGITNETMREVECFWNQIMMEHALFIRGLLDPTETELFNAADGFAKDFAVLLENCRTAHSRTIDADTLEQTVKFRDFKEAGTKGIQQCKIRSVILPLLADHVLREANHYIRLLKEE